MCAGEWVEIDYAAHEPSNLPPLDRDFIMEYGYIDLNMCRSAVTVPFEANRVEAARAIVNIHAEKFGGGPDKQLAPFQSSR